MRHPLLIDFLNDFLTWTAAEDAPALLALPHATQLSQLQHRATELRACLLATCPKCGGDNISAVPPVLSVLHKYNRECLDCGWHYHLNATHRLSELEGQVLLKTLTEAGKAQIMQAEGLTTKLTPEAPS